MPTNRSGTRASFSRNTLCGISDKKARGNDKELCSQPDRCVGIFGRFVQKQLGDSKRATITATASKAATSVPSSTATWRAR